jgi:uncharacterized protein
MSVTIDVRDLLAQPGSTRRMTVREPVAGMSSGLAAVPEDRPLEADLLLEGLVEGILVTGDVRGTEVLSCARCLSPVEEAFELHVQELFVPGATADDDEYPVEDGSIDLEPMLRDAIVLAMPFAPLCRPDCQGLCERCGGNRNLGECACGPATDSRWEALAGLDLDAPAPEPDPESTPATTTNGRPR